MNKNWLVCIILSAIWLFSCTSDETPPKLSYEFMEVVSVPTQSTCTISCRNESVDDVTIRARLLLSKNEDFDIQTTYPVHVSGDSLVCNLTNLDRNTVYYYCFEMFTNQESVRIDGVHQFKTLGGGNITVTTSEVINITQTTATGGGSVTTNGDYSVSERGICWGSQHNPNNSQDYHSTSGTGAGSFSVNMTNLIPDTTYYVRAYAVCAGGVVYGNEVSFVTSEIPSFTVNISANPSNGGVVDGGGIYQEGQSCTVKATANSGYSFVNWTENGEQVSANADYPFTVSRNRVLVANFSASSYIVSAVAEPEDGGTITGAGGYEHGERCILTATANQGYTFEKWTKNGTQVSTTATYSFTVTSSCILKAHFKANTYTISVSANPTAGGTVSGGNTYHYGQSCTVTALVNSGYAFVNWTENGNVVSTNTNYTFTITGNRTLVANFTANPQNYTISVSANPSNGGGVSGGGTYQQGQSCTVHATANTGYTFTNWTENGSVVSTNANYTFTVTSNRTLVAHFTVNPQNYTISVSANPSNGGGVSGGGTYQQGQSCTVHATANMGYTFTNWTENGSVVSTSANYTFTVTSNRTLVANFSQQSTWPNGVLPGVFSVSATQQVHFSQGNLQYQASSNTWRFAINQYDFTGNENSNISQTYNGWIDLFGWGTSGYNHGAVCYQPWSTNTNASNYYAYGSNVAHLWYQSGKADWGYNAICNGGNQEAQWHTLSKEAWEYIFTRRNTASGIRYARGNVNGINGILLFPDDWEESLYPIVNYNTSSGGLSHFNDNTILLSDWEQLEINGVVFLPLAGFRSGTDVDLSKGLYWSSTNWSYGTMSYCVCFDNSQLDPSNSNTGLTMRNKSWGLSVRLVRDVE